MQRSNSAIFDRSLSPKSLKLSKIPKLVAGTAPEPEARPQLLPGGGRDLLWEERPPTGARCGSVGGGGWDGRTQPTPPRLKDSSTQIKVYVSGIRLDVMT